MSPFGGREPEEERRMEYGCEGEGDQGIGKNGTSFVTRNE